MEERLNSELNACLLRCVIHAANDNDHEALAELGLDASLMERAKNMNADVFTRLSQYRIADVRLDSRRFGLMLDFVDHEREMNTLINTLIALEASQTMLDKLAGIDPREYRNRRKTLGLPAAHQGRPPDLSAVQSDSLYEILRKQPAPTAHEPRDLLHWYCVLGQESGLPLSRIWHHLMKFG